MFRPSPRLLTALLWLAIALLPLRGFAAAMMPAAAAPLHGSVAMTELAAPCHGGQAHDVSPADGAHAGCSLCDLCHSSALAVDMPSLRLATLAHASPPRQRAAAPEARAPDGLFRPPRAGLA
jgi:hypothetical protein